MKLQAFLPLVTYSDPNADTVAANAAAVAGLLDADLNVLAVNVTIPQVSNALSRFLLDVPDMIRQAETTSRKHGERLIAAGLAYLDFGFAHPALLRLMFASNRPDHALLELEQQSDRAFKVLVESVEQILAETGQGGTDPCIDIAAIWSVVHGLTEVGVAMGLKFLPELSGPDRDDIATAIIDKVLPKPANQG